MLKTLLAVILILSILPLKTQAAEVKRRHLELELEDVPGVKGYEVRLFRIVNGKKKQPAIFKLKGSVWAADLVPGKYKMAVRSVDSRGVPGNWSPDQELVVKLAAPQQLSPKTGDKIASKDDEKEKVKFSWEKIEGADKYKVQVIDTAKKEKREETTSDTDIEFKLPVAQSYIWSVTPLFQDETEGDRSEMENFDLIGARLDRPENHQLEEYNTAVISWKKVDLANNYNYQLEVKTEKGWKLVEKKNVNKPGVKYAQALPTGDYRLKVTALGELRGESEPLVQEFKSTNFTRSPAALEQLKSESSYETRGKFFAMGSYFLSLINYSSYYVEGSNPGKTAYTGIGGTGRLGFGTWFSDEGHWGGMTVIDLSGYIIKTSTYVYPSVDLLGVYKTRAGGLGQMRFNLGVRYQQLPITTGDSNNPSAFNQSSISTLSPVFSFNIAHAMNKKIGLQLNASISPTLVGISTPDNKANIPMFNYQIGLLGSMKLWENWVGFMGYAYRYEAAAYATAPGFDPTSLTLNLDHNQVEISGHYLNLMLEYGF